MGKTRILKKLKEAFEPLIPLRLEVETLSDEDKEWLEAEFKKYLKEHPNTNVQRWLEDME